VVAAIGDYTAVIANPDSPGEPLARALLYRGIARERNGKASQAFQDYLAAGSHAEAHRDVRRDALCQAFRAAWREKDSGRMDMALRAAANGLAALNAEQRVETLVAVLQALAQPEMREAWSRILRGLLETQHPEVAERMAYLRPVADVLESGDPSRLNPLPPEQRAFAQEVLRRFNDASNAESGASAPTR